MLDNINQIALEFVKSGNRRLLFQEKANRDAVYQAAKKLTHLPLRRSSVRNQQLDPRYTVEGSHLPDKGLGNDYRHYFASLYELEMDRLSW